MLPILEIPSTGNVNRRDPRDMLKKGDVLARENLIVYGIADAKRMKKSPGSDRYTTNALGTFYTSGYRYYSNSIAKTFAYNNGTKKLYFVDENGGETSVLDVQTPPGISSYPVFETIKVSGQNTLLFSDGTNPIYTYDGNIGNVFTSSTNDTTPLVDMIAYLDRIFGFKENSDVLLGSENVTNGGSPTNFSSATDSFEITVGAKRGSKLMRIVFWLGTIYLFKDDSIWVLEGNTPSSFSVREIIQNVGLAARRGIAVGRNAIYFLGSDFEVYQFQGTMASLKILTYNIALSGDRTNNLNEVINKFRMSQVSATFHDFLFRLSFVETGETVSKMEYIFNTTNDTDGFTRGNNVSCYFIYDKTPDIGQLVTGRSDTGRLMHQYRGLNWDNQAASPTMSVKLQTGFIRPKELENIRFKRIFGDFQVLGAEDLTVNYYLDTRLAKSDIGTVSMSIQGETKSLTSFIRTNSQTSITSRGILKWAKSKGQSLMCELDFDRKDIDLSMSKFYTEVIVKNRKRSKHVGV